MDILGVSQLQPASSYKKDTISALLDSLRKAGLSISVEGEGLKVQGPKNAMTPALAAQIRECKAGLIAHLPGAEYSAGVSNETPVQVSTFRQLGAGTQNYAPETVTADEDETRTRPTFLEEVDEAAIAKAYETKATLPGGKPPLQEVEEIQAWLATVDWRHGLRCGRTGEQCLTCKGLPCRNSTAWPDGIRACRG